VTVLIGVTAGLLIGATLGAMGGGGAIITVPVLIYLLGQSPTEATTGSLVVVGVSAAVSMTAHHRAGRVRWVEGAAFGLLGTLGTAVGSRLSTRVDPQVLLLSFAILLIVVAALLVLRARSRWRAGPADEGELGLAEPVVQLRPTLMCNCPRALRVVGAASVVGLVTGFFGVGGGFVVVPALVMALDFTMPVAAGTSLLVIAINSATALASRLGAGINLDWPLLLIMTATAVGGSLVGTRVAGRVSPRALTHAFAALLIVVAGYTGVQTLVHLAAA